MKHMVRIWRRKREELLKVGQFLLMLLGVELLLTWVLCHCFRREGVSTVLFDQAVFYTAIIGIILLVGLTDILFARVKQSVRLIGISITVYAAGMIYFTFTPMGLLKDWRLVLWYSLCYATFMFYLIYMWRAFEKSTERKYAACIAKFQQSAGNIDE